MRSAYFASFMPLTMETMGWIGKIISFLFFFPSCTDIGHAIIRFCGGQTQQWVHLDCDRTVLKSCSFTFASEKSSRWLNSDISGLFFPCWPRLVPDEQSSLLIRSWHLSLEISSEWLTLLLQFILHQPKQLIKIQPTFNLVSNV